MPADDAQTDAATKNEQLRLETLRQMARLIEELSGDHAAFAAPSPAGNAEKYAETKDAARQAIDAARHLDDVLERS